MRKYLYFVAGFSAALAVYMASRNGDVKGALRRMVGGRIPVGELAHQLQSAWADHHTRA